MAALLLAACGRVTRGEPGEMDGSAGTGGTSIVDDDDEMVDDDDLDDDDGVVIWPPLPNNCQPGIPPTSQLPRLTHVQYDNTIRALTGLDTSPSTLLAPESPGSMHERSWAGYREAAVSIAEQVMADVDLKKSLIPCDTADDACAAQFIREFGSRAYRRPLLEEEAARYEALYADRNRLTANGSFEEAVQMLLEVFLVSPSFLMRNELAELPAGNYYALSGYEVAARLAYLLWDSMPDEELFARAREGALVIPEGILEQATRMLEDEKARPVVARFHQWYARMGPGTRWAVDMTRDPGLFPAFDPAQAPLFWEETVRLFDHVVFELRGTFQDLLTTPLGFVNATLAPLYGLDPARYGASLELVEHDPAARPGVFTRAGFLAVHSSPERTSPILRGAFLQREVLCTEVGPPPPDGPSTPLPMDPDLVTNRQRVEAQTGAPQCAVCHVGFINPGGFALEGFDAVGAVQTTDNGAPVDTSASVEMGGVQVNVDGAADLMTRLAESPAASLCYARKWVEHAYQRVMNPNDACVAEELAQRLLAGDYSVLNLIADLTQAESFRYRAREE